jgi:hypothetical protein
MEPLSIAFDRLTEEEKVSLRGMCSAPRCTKANRAKQQLCNEHKYTRTPKCVKQGCLNFSRTGKTGFCVAHSRVSIKTPKLRPCKGGCGVPDVRTKLQRCKRCVAVQPCNRVGGGCDGFGVAGRGGRCLACPLEPRLKCLQAKCVNLRKNGSRGFCVSCAKKAGVFFCIACKTNKSQMHHPICRKCATNKPI